MTNVLLFCKQVISLVPPALTRGLVRKPFIMASLTSINGDCKAQRLAYRRGPSSGQGAGRRAVRQVSDNNRHSIAKLVTAAYLADAQKHLSVLTLCATFPVLFAYARRWHLT